MKSILSAVPALKENPQSGKDLERALPIECSSLTPREYRIPSENYGQMATADFGCPAATPLISSHSANGISNAAIGTKITQVTMGPRNTSTNCNGSPTTHVIDTTTPSHPSTAGIIRPRSSSQEKMVLPTAKNSAPTSPSAPPCPVKSVPRACAVWMSGALAPPAVAAHSSPSDRCTEIPPF